MAEICISVVSKLAEYTVAPVLRQFGYLINYKSNVEDLTEKVTTLTAKRDGVQQRVDAANRNLEAIRPEVQNWLERVDQTIQEKETCFEVGRVAKATTCCSSNGWCPNLKVRHSLSRKATKLVPRVDDLITDGNFTAISRPAPPLKIEYPAIPYIEDSTEAPAKPHEGASSPSGTSNPAKPPGPMDLSERLKYRLPYTKDLLTALQDDKISMIGISGTIREIDTVTTKEFMKRMKQKKLFEEVAMAVVSQDPDLKRIQGEIAEMLDVKLENESLVERAERLRAVLQASDSKRILVILTDVCGMPDMEAIGISRVDIKKSCKIMLISQLSNVFGEMGTQSNFELLSQSTPIARPVEFESRISVIRDVMDALTDDESNPIVICGMGGVGKTTLVMEIGAKVTEVDLFDDVAIAEFTQEPDLIKIQGKIAKALGLKLEAEDDRAAKLRERLSMGTKKVLVILDNVWKQPTLWDIGIPISRDPKSCKLLISSRDQDIFKDTKTRRNFLIDGLPKHDAWILFKKVAGGSIEDLKLRPIAEQVLDECGGLPVAISTVGGALQGKEISIWRNALRQLKQACPEDVPGVIEHVYKKIEFSYNCLPSEQAKSCFLLCSLFPESEDFPTRLLVAFGIGLELFKGIDSISEGRDCVESLVDILKNRSLLLNGHEKGYFKMHDVVRDVAVYIASEETRQKKNDQLGRRVVLRQGEELNHWRKNNVNKESIYCSSLTTNMSTTELLLLLAVDGSKLELPATIFNGMEDLKVLFFASSILPSLPLLKNLQTLVLADCHLFNFDVIGELRTLMILNLQGSDIKQLPDTFKNLSNLRLLDLSECMELEVISPGVLSSLSHLEELYMWHSFKIWVVEKLGSKETITWISQLEVDAQPKEVDKWKKFNRLAVEKLASTETTTDQVSQPEEEEEDAESSESEELDSLGYLFANYVRYWRNYDHLTRWANSMDWGVGLLSELLSLSCLTTLEVVLPPVVILRTSKLFHKLQRFKINIGWDVPKPLEELEGIENYLRVHDLDESSLVDTGISLLLKKTKKLELKLNNLTDPLNILDVNCCANLESLALKDCDSLEYLIDITVKQDTPRSVFPVLNYLEINGARRLKEIFHGDLPLESLQKLETLTLRDCQSLEAIFALEGSEHHVKEINFLSLTRLELKGLPSFTFQSLDVNCCANLESLTLEDCDSLEYLIDMTVKQDTPRSVFPVLNYLDISRAKRLKEIFHGDLPLGSLQKLETLTLRDCQSLEAIFALEGSEHHVKEINFLSLTLLELKGLPSITFQSLDVNCCANFKSLALEDCDSLEYLIDITVKQDTPRSVFPVLNYLEINGARRLKEIFHGDLPLESLQKLETLFLQNLPALTTIWTIGSQSRWLGDLAAVRYISIRDCRSLEAIFALEGSGHHVKEINFRSLTELALEGLPSFTRMSRSTRKGLERQLEVSILHPNSLTVEHSLFSDPKVVFPVLRDLYIQGLGNFKEIWNNQLSPNSFSELRMLTVWNCDKLLHLVPTQMQNRLQRLERIRIHNCSSLEEIFEVGRLTVNNEGNASISQSDKIPSNISQPDQGMQINDIMDFKQCCQGFQNLTELHVSSCGSLRYLLTPSIARGLVKLERLTITSCEMIEAIVAADEGEETEDESMLPQLSSLTLTDLPNLGSFSQNKYNFDWPLLQMIYINKCNKMNNFCSGSLSISREVRIYVSDSGENLEQELNDSNKES